MCDCQKAKANTVGDAWSDAINTVKNYGNTAANEVVNSAIPPVKEACKQGAIIGIKEYAVPVTLGIALTLTAAGSIGFVLGRHWQSKKKKKKATA